MAGYYTHWIWDFAAIARPLCDLQMKNAVFRWIELEQGAMEELIRCLLSKPVLIGIDYGPTAGEIVLMVDASLVGWGAVLM